ncbi:ABC transporter substrate-binding protein, partial [Streptococcus pasteurianus]
SPENVKEFIKKYEDAYGTSPDHFAALAYDATNLIAQAMEKAGSTDSEAVQKALAETKDFQGVTGKFSFDKDHNPVKEVFVQELQGG